MTSAAPRSGINLGYLSRGTSNNDRCHNELLPAHSAQRARMLCGQHIQSLKQLRKEESPTQSVRQYSCIRDTDLSNMQEAIRI